MNFCFLLAVQYKDSRWTVDILVDTVHLLSFEDTVLYCPRGGDQKRGFDVRNCPI